MLNTSHMPASLFSKVFLVNELKRWPSALLEMPAWVHLLNVLSSMVTAGARDTATLTQPREKKPV